jgi:hypothetical protein
VNLIRAPPYINEMTFIFLIYVRLDFHMRYDFNMSFYKFPPWVPPAGGQARS